MTSMQRPGGLSDAEWASMQRCYSHPLIPRVVDILKRYDASQRWDPKVSPRPTREDIAAEIIDIVARNQALLSNLSTKKGTS